ncbi:uncharacterized protein F5147DRAFT_548529, partial [Suillus discolor]
MRLDGTVLDVETGSIELHQWRGRVNNFTDWILFLLQCNTDTQFIGLGLLSFTSEYITKGDV